MKMCNKIFMIIVIVKISIILPIDFVLGGTLYRCTDRDGSVILTDSVIGDKCLPAVRFREKTQEELLQEEKEKARAVAEEEPLRAERKRKLLLNECVEKVEKRHRDNWDADCRLYNRPNKCNLPIANATRWDTVRIAERNQCFQAYPQTPYPQLPPP